MVGKTDPKKGPKTTVHFRTRNCFGLPKRSPNTAAAPARFCIDRGSHFGTFFLFIGLVFGTRFAALELAPPSNLRNWFAGFSRVRRVRSVSTMTFDVPFGIEFSIVSKSCKSIDLIVNPLLWACFFVSKRVTFRLNFYSVFICFSKPVLWTFFKWPRCQSLLKVVFWCLFRFWVFPKNAFWTTF